MTESAFRKADKLIRSSQNPTKSLKLPSTKYLLPINPEQEHIEIGEAVATLENALREQRVERNCGRAKAVWLPDEELVLVNKPLGNCFKSIGRQESRGILLYPEEALFLLEMNKLALYWNEVLLSIEHAYNILLNANKCTLPIYKLYRTLVTNSYKVSRKVINHHRVEQGTNVNAQFKNNDAKESCEPSLKRIKLYQNEDGNRVGCTFASESIEDSFQLLSDLKKLGPSISNCSPNLDQDIFYEVYSPETLSKKNLDPDFSINLLSGDIIPPQIGVHANSSTTHLYSVVPNDSVMFYQIDKVHVGDLF